MKIDLTCPVELWQYAMPTESESECTFVMNNLSSKVVTSVQVTLNCFDRNDELLFRQTERIQGLKAGVGERFTAVVLPSEWNGVEGVDLVIEKVWFDDATIWRKGNAPLTYYASNALQPGRALDELRFVAGQDAAGYPQLQDQVWMCVCGRPNGLDSDRCCRCERRRETVFASFSRENVNHIIAAHEQKLAETARKAREENNLLQENQEKQRAAKRRRRNTAIRWTTTLVLLAAAAVITIVWGIPAVQYNTALDLLRDGHYDQARAAFNDMGEYRDAAVQMLECDYQKALSLQKTGDAESLEAAEAQFLALNGYQESAVQAKQSAYALAVLYLTEGRYEQAAAKFQALGGYLDSAEKAMESLYRQADEMMQNGSCEEARGMFASLGDYSDASDKAKECTYRMAVLLMKEGEYQEALDLLAQLDTYTDAQERAAQCHYALAEQELAAGAFEKAGEQFLLAGGYADAQNRANECLYNLAQEKRGAGEYEKAMELFLRVPDYENSLEMAKQCVYEQAEAMAASGELGGAVALLETITNYADTAEKLDEYRFQLAEQALKNGDAAQAERLLVQIGDHKGLETQLKKVRYQLAEEAREAGEYSAALERYEMLDSYRDSKTKAKQCRYAMASAAQEAGDYETAIALYTELGTYKESRTRISQCRYAIAQAALNAAEYEKAISLLEELGSFEDSRKLLEEARYQSAMAMKEAGHAAQAMAALEALNTDEAVSALQMLRMEEAAKLEAAGDYAAAAQLYAAVPDSEEALTHFQACQYKLAEQMYDSGDLPGAAAAFHSLGSYEDAASRSEACYDEYYGQVARQARELYAAKDDAGVIAVLQAFEMNVLSQTYGDLPEIFEQACLHIGDSLYAEGKAYEAIPYYQRAGADEKLKRRAYLILGEWESATGKTAVFRTDGTCDLMGETLYFRVSNFSLYTGAAPDEMSITHKISVLDQTGMSLRDQRGGQDVLYKLSRSGPFELPQMELPETARETEMDLEIIPAAAEEEDASAAVSPETPGFVPVVTPAPENQMLVTGDENGPNE